MRSRRPLHGLTRLWEKLLVLLGGLMNRLDLRSRFGPVGTRTAAYRVTVRYREPSYEQHAGAKVHPFRWTYRVHASDADEARLLALEEFRDVEEASGVGWGRVVVAVEVEPA